MARRNYAHPRRARTRRVIAGLALAVGLVAVTAAPASAGVHNHGQPFAGACNFVSDTTPTYTAYSLRPVNSGATCSNVWRFQVLCGNYPTPQLWVKSVVNTTINLAWPGVIYNPTWTCQSNGFNTVFNTSFVVSAGPYYNICSNQNSQYPWVYLRSDVPCTLG